MQKRRGWSKYPAYVRQQVVHAYFTTDGSIRSLARDFGVNRSVVEKWVKQGRAEYEVEQDIQRNIRTFASATNTETIMPQKSLTPEDMQKRIKELEKELEYERMRATVYDTMIDVAEEMLKIPIRKKSGAKQFKK